MLKLLTILCCCFAFTRAGAQQTAAASFDSVNVQAAGSNGPFVFVTRIAGNFASVSVDVLDNIYLVTANDRLKKFAPNGDSVSVFNDVKEFGTPALIDVSNPLKLLLYYQNFSTVVVLDRFLSRRNSIDLRRQNIFRVTAIATSYDNNIRVFDEGDLKLKKIDDDGTVLSESNDFRQMFEEVPTPARILENDNSIYVYDPEKGFYIFDYYYSFRTQLPFLHWHDITAANNRITGFSADSLYSYEMNSLNLKVYALPAFLKGYRSITALNGKLYVLRETGLEIYKII